MSTTAIVLNVLLILIGVLVYSVWDRIKRPFGDE